MLQSQTLLTPTSGALHNPPHVVNHSAILLPQPSTNVSSQQAWTTQWSGKPMPYEGCVLSHAWNASFLFHPVCRRDADVTYSDNINTWCLTEKESD